MVDASVFGTSLLAFASNALLIASLTRSSGFEKSKAIVDL
jgi:hypothetical protein